MSDDNVVTLRMPAAYYATLVTELGFAASCAGDIGGHNRTNAQRLLEMVVKQGGADLVPAEPTKDKP